MDVETEMPLGRAAYSRSRSNLGKKYFCEFVIGHLLNGKDVNLVDHYGKSALMLACRWSQPESVPLLIEAGADVNLVNQEV